MIKVLFNYMTRGRTRVYCVKNIIYNNGKWKQP